MDILNFFLPLPKEVLEVMADVFCDSESPEGGAERIKALGYNVRPDMVKAYASIMDSQSHLDHFGE